MAKEDLTKQSSNKEVGSIAGDGKVSWDAWQLSEGVAKGNAGIA